MSAPPRNDGLSRKEEMNVSAAAMSEVPWVPAVAAGAAVAGADLVLHAVTGHIGLSPIASSLSAGSVAFGLCAASVLEGLWHSTHISTSLRLSPCALRSTWHWLQFAIATIWRLA